MMFYRMSYVKRAVRTFCWLIFNKIENNSNSDFHRNGESLFIKNLFIYYHRKKRRNITIFDVGANFGEYSDMLIKIAKDFNLDIDLHLFEPQKRCIEVLRSKNYKNINQVGISDEEGEGYIFFDDEGSSFANLFGEGRKFEKIRLMRLDSYIKEKNLDHCDFLKIDVEGNEIKVIKSLGDFLNEDFLDFLQFEYGATYIRSHTTLFDIYRILEEKGFIIFKIMPEGLEMRRYKTYMENFVYQNFVAISPRIYNDILSTYRV